jgi:hypothetical protein
VTYDDDDDDDDGDDDDDNNNNNNKVSLMVDLQLWKIFGSSVSKTYFYVL